LFAALFPARLLGHDAPGGLGFAPPAGRYVFRTPSRGKSRCRFFRRGGSNPARRSLLRASCRHRRRRRHGPTAGTAKRRRNGLRPVFRGAVRTFCRPNTSRRRRGRVV